MKFTELVYPTLARILFLPQRFYPPRYTNSPPYIFLLLFFNKHTRQNQQFLDLFKDFVSAIFNKEIDGKKCTQPKGG